MRETCSREAEGSLKVLGLGPYSPGEPEARTPSQSSAAALRDGGVQGGFESVFPVACPASSSQRVSEQRVAEVPKGPRSE